MICCVCNREREPGSVIELTDTEREQIRRMTGQPAPASYAYCKACWKVVSNKQQSASLFKGLLQASLRQNGVPNADKMAARYYKFLLDRASKNPRA